MSINVAAIPSPFIHATIKRRKNTWYTIASGNWSDPNIWMSNSRRRYSSPQTGDDVSIGLGHTVTVNTAAISIYNLSVAGSLLFDTTARVITVNGNIQATGAVNLSGAAHNLILNGVNNYVVNFTSGTTSTVTYSRVGDQPVMDLSYINLTTQNIGAKILPATAFTINGTTTVSTGSVLSKLDTNQVTFIGALNATSSGIDFSGNPTIENRGGYTLNSLTSFNSGTSTWSFTTATQTATITTSTLQFNGNVSVVGAITVNEAGTGIMSLNQPIDCTSGGGSVVAKGNIYFNSTSSLPSFTTGTFDRTSFANTVGYTMGASITLPYTSYWSLLVSNTGTKVPVGNTTLLGNLLVNNSVSAAGTFDVSTFDLTVTGTTTPSIGTLKKTGAGNILFIGALTPTLNSPASIIDFRTGNPDVELRGGVTLDFNVGTFFSGTGTWTFTTNNQTIGGFGQIWNAPIVVAGAITVTLAHQGGNSTAMQIPSLNGTISTSKFLIGGTGVSILYFTTSTSQMPVGIFDHSTNSHTIGWNFDGDYTLPYTTFNGGLFIGGSGTKTAAADVALSGNLGITTSTTGALELGTFNLSVGGTTTINSSTGVAITSLSKTGAGNVLFTGLLTLTGNNPSLNLTGNPSVECRGGISFSISGGVYQFNGSSIFTFTTNNQNITTSTTYNFPYNILISGAITLTNATANLGLRMTGTLNGNNAASTFDNRGRMEYQATQQPMLTGVLQTNLAANTFLYNAAGNQDVKGTTYRTLTLAGSGVKTLQGNVVVATLYTLTAPATLALNGFTRT